MNRPVATAIAGIVLTGSTMSGALTAFGGLSAFGGLAVLGGVTVLGSSTALAADPAHPSWSAKRLFVSQVVNCMRKRMADDKHISYNQAAKICKDEVSKQTEGADAGPLVAADTKH
ncbi:MAG TPA: hypothetical protein VK715_01545 [Steroidobacteraceae bacterium]|jgi:hypothetical protein|nr:hypothetical protein [Steroidobacteraceae bacterium]